MRNHSGGRGRTPSISEEVRIPYYQKLLVELKHFQQKRGFKLRGKRAIGQTNNPLGQKERKGGSILDLGRDIESRDPG